LKFRTVYGVDFSGAEHLPETQAEQF
jgi:hypothetical protein